MLSKSRWSEDTADQDRRVDMMAVLPPYVFSNLEESNSPVEKRETGEGRDL